MIITNTGKQGVDASDNCEVSKVVFSDLRLSSVITPEELTGVKGSNTKPQEATIGLLSSGHVVVQATADANFTVRSAFIFARGNGQEFLLAVTNTKDGEVNEEISFDKLRKLSFNAISSELVMKSDVSSVVSSVIAETPHPDFASYASDVATQAKSYTDIKTSGMVDNARFIAVTNSKADVNSLSNFATHDDLSEVKNNTSQALTSKADTAILADYAKASELASYATAEELSTLSSNTDSLLTSKANKSDFTSYMASQSGYNGYTYSELNKHDKWIVNNNAEIIKNRNAMATSMADMQGSLNAFGKQSFKYKDSWHGDILALANEDDGSYDLYGNMQNAPDGFYGYGLVLKWHNAWNAFLMLFDNAQGIWTNRQGPSGWNGWRRIVTNDMLENLQRQINELKNK